MNETVAALGIVIAVIMMLSLLSMLQALHRIEQKQADLETRLNTIIRAVSATQSEVRQRLKSDGVEPILDKPKAEQHYEGRGVKRVARGGKTDPASGESITARISSVKRRSYGGTSSNPPGGGLL